MVTARAFPYRFAGLAALAARHHAGVTAALVQAALAEQEQAAALGGAAEDNALDWAVDELIDELYDQGMTVLNKVVR